MLVGEAYLNSAVVVPIDPWWRQSASEANRG